MQRDWPNETFLNQEGNPLLSLEGEVRGSNDIQRVALERVQLITPEALHALNQDLCDLRGPQWWAEPEFARFREAMSKWIPRK
jgi:hypothetical protein